MKYCKWTYIDTDDFYETSCDNGQCFIEGSVKENHYMFCPYCGKKIKENKNENT